MIAVTPQRKDNGMGFSAGRLALHQKEKGGKLIGNQGPKKDFEENKKNPGKKKGSETGPQLVG